MNYDGCYFYPDYAVAKVLPRKHITARFDHLDQKLHALLQRQALDPWATTLTLRRMLGRVLACGAQSMAYGGHGPSPPIGNDPY